MNVLVASEKNLVLLPTASLWRCEVVRFVRQRSRVIGALGTPLVFWLLIGCGLKYSFTPAGAAETTNYLEYAFTGTMVLILLFTSIFSTISIIEDRRGGFLQGVLVAPVARPAIVAGKVLGATTLAVGQAALLLPAAPLVGVPLTVGMLPAVLGVLVLLSIGLSAMGFAFAWRMDSTQGFHTIMNLVLMPMWLLSGAFFPASGASAWVQVLMTVNPLTYGVGALRRVLYSGDSAAVEVLPSMEISIVLTGLFTVAMLVLAVSAVSRDRVQ